MSEQNEKKFVISDVSELQAKIMIQALDLYSRLLMGQLDELDYVFRSYFWSKKYDGNKILDLIDKIREIVFPTLGRNSYNSIGSDKVPEESKISYDMLRAIRNCLAWSRNPRGGITVDFDPLTIRYSRENFIKVNEE